MKLMVLLSRVPYPLDKGDKLRAYNQIREFSKNHDIYLCCLNDATLHPEAVNELSKYCKAIRIIRLFRPNIALRLMKGLFSSNPLQVSYFYSRAAAKEVDQFIEDFLPNHIFCQLIRTTEYVRKYTVIPKTLDYMDTFSIGMLRRLENANFYQRPFMKMEAVRLKNYEKNIFPFFEVRTIISEQDRALIEHGRNEEIYVIPNGVNRDFFSPRAVEIKYDVVFTGNMGYPPNVESALYLCQQVLPIVKKEYPNIKLVLAGAEPVAEVKGLANNNVEVTGWVDDIREYYAASRLFVAPMQIGTGLQNKLLEAMSMRLPCITSQLANNALKAKNGEEVIIGTTPEDYASQIIALLKNDDERIRIAANGYQFVHQNFNWEVNTRKMLTYIEKAKV